VTDGLSLELLGLLACRSNLPGASEDADSIDDQTGEVHLDRAERNVERDGDVFLGLGGHVIDCRCLGRPVDAGTEIVHQLPCG
jgi:hypothetical protein